MSPVAAERASAASAPAPVACVEPAALGLLDTELEDPPPQALKRMQASANTAIAPRADVPRLKFFMRPSWALPLTISLKRWCAVLGKPWARCPQRRIPVCPIE